MLALDTTSCGFFARNFITRNIYYTVSPENFKIIGSAKTGLDYYLTGKTHGGKTIFLEVVGPPHMIGSAKFSTVTNSKEVTLTKDGTWSWKSLPVVHIDIGIPRTSLKFTTFSAEYNLSEKPKMLAPAINQADVNIQGLWHGTFEDKPAMLSIDSRKGNEFQGVLSTTATAGVIRVAIQGTLSDNNAIAFQETQVLSKPPSMGWTLGTDVGKVVRGGKGLTGSGSDGKSPAYTWSFSKK